MPSMRTIIEITASLELEAIDYSAFDSQGAERLNRVELVPIAGPLAVGKTTVIRAASALDIDFGRVKSFTTREQRPGEDDDAYRYLPHNEDTLQEIESEVIERKLAQYVVHPTTGNVYGTNFDDYKHSYPMLDITPGRFDHFLKLPFKDIHKTTLVAHVGIWQQRIQDRIGATSLSDIKKRISEGIFSLEWSSDQENMIWIENTGRSAIETATELIGIVRNQKEPDPQARKTGYELLSTLKRLEDEM